MFSLLSMQQLSWHWHSGLATWSASFWNLFTFYFLGEWEGESWPFPGSLPNAHNRQSELCHAESRNLELYPGFLCRWQQSRYLSRCLPPLMCMSRRLHWQWDGNLNQDTLIHNVGIPRGNPNAEPNTSCFGYFCLQLMRTILSNTSLASVYMWLNWKYELKFLFHIVQILVPKYVVSPQIHEWFLYRSKYS